MKTLELEPCSPAPWARGGHQQTIIGNLFSQMPVFSEELSRAEILTLGGDKLIVRYLAPKSFSNWMVNIFHGLSGSAADDYIIRTAQLARNFGHGVVLVNHRGCGEGAGLAREPYHSGRGEDVSAVLDWSRKQFPSTGQLGIGYSLGGNALLCALCGIRGETTPSAAIAINSPIDLRAASTQLAVGFNRIYDQRFVIKLKKDLRTRLKDLAPGNRPKFPMRMSLKDFDDIYTGPFGGFGNAEGYYSTCSTAPHLERIKVPTVLLTASDDPIVPVEAYRRAKVSDQIALHIEEHGGHMGYIHKRKTPLGTKRWLEYAISEYIKKLTE